MGIEWAGFYSNFNAIQALEIGGKKIKKHKSKERVFN
jgi:hypothetical protein